MRTLLIACLLSFAAWGQTTIKAGFDSVKVKDRSGSRSQVTGSLANIERSIADFNNGSLDTTALRAGLVWADTYNSTLVIDRNMSFLNTPFIANGYDSLEIRFTSDGKWTNTDTDSNSFSLKMTNCTNIRIYGNGFISGGFTYTTTPDTNSGKIFAQDLIFVGPGCENITIEDLNFTLAGDQAIRIETTSAGDTIKNVLIQNTRHYQNHQSIRVANDSNNGYIENIRILNNDFDYGSVPQPPTVGLQTTFGGDRVIGTTYKINGLQIIGNRITNPGLFALEIWSNAAQSQLGNMAKEVVVRDNVLGQATYRTCTIIGDGVTFSGNTVYDSLTYFEPLGRDMTFDDNRFYWTGIKSPDAIDTAGEIEYYSNRWKIRNNLFFNSNTRGGSLYLLEVNEVEATGNSFVYSDSAFNNGSPHVYLQLRRSNRSKINDNLIRFQDGARIENVSLLVLDDLVDCEIERNIIQIDSSVSTAVATLGQLISFDDCFRTSLKNNKVVADSAYAFSNGLVFSSNASPTYIKRTWNGSAWVDTTVTDVVQTVGIGTPNDVYLIGSEPTGDSRLNPNSFASYQTAYTYNDIDGYLWNRSGNPYYKQVDPRTATSGDAWLVASSGVLDCEIVGNDWDVNSKLNVTSNRYFRVNAVGDQIWALNDYRDNSHAISFTGTFYLFANRQRGSNKLLGTGAGTGGTDYIYVQDFADSLNIAATDDWTAVLSLARAQAQTIYLPNKEMRIKNFNPGSNKRYIGIAGIKNSLSVTNGSNFAPTATGDTLVLFPSASGNGTQFHNIGFAGRNSANDTASVGVYYTFATGENYYRDCNFFYFERIFGTARTDTSWAIKFFDEQQTMYFEGCYFRDNDVHIWAKETNGFNFVHCRFLEHHVYGLFFRDHEGASFLGCHFENAQQESEGTDNPHGLILQQAKGFSFIGPYVELPDTAAVRWIDIQNDPTGGSPEENPTTLFISGGRMSGDIGNEYVISLDKNFTQRARIDWFSSEGKGTIAPVEARDTSAFHINLYNVGFTTASTPGVEMLNYRNFNSDDYTYSSGALSVPRDFDRWIGGSDSLAGRKDLRTNGHTDQNANALYGINLLGQRFAGPDGTGKLNVTSATDTFDIDVVFSNPITQGWGTATGEFMIFYTHSAATNDAGQVFVVKDWQRANGSDTDMYSTSIDTLINKQAGGAANDKIGSITVVNRTASGYTIQVAIDVAGGAQTSYRVGGETRYGNNIRSATISLRP